MQYKYVTQLTIEYLIVDTELFKIFIFISDDRMKGHMFKLCSSLFGIRCDFHMTRNLPLKA